MLGERIKRARITCGLSLRDAAERSEMSAMAISKFERGEATPTSRSLLALARTLGVRTEYFFRTTSVELESVEFSRSALGQKARVQIEGQVLNQVERFLEIVDIYPDRTPVFSCLALPDVAAYDSLEDIAVLVRDAWDLGSGPIPNLVTVFEETGIFVAFVNGHPKFEGLMASATGYRVMAVNALWSDTTQRFHLARFLGRLVLEGRVHGLEGDKAWERFAGAFLVPSGQALNRLGSSRNRLERQELAALENEFGLSIEAWLDRAFDLGVISGAARGRIRRDLRQRSSSELELDSTKPSLQRRLVYRALSEGMVSESKASELLRGR